MSHRYPVGALSDRTRQAVQDYTALNTIARAFELSRVSSELHTDTPAFALELLRTLAELEDPPSVRIPLGCPLGRRLSALGVVRSRRGGTRGVVDP